MEQDKFLRIGYYITTGGINTATQLILKLIDDGLDPLSFEALAVWSIISYHVGKNKQKITV